MALSRSAGIATKCLPPPSAVCPFIMLPAIRCAQPGARARRAAGHARRDLLTSFEFMLAELRQVLPRGPHRSPAAPRGRNAQAPASAVHPGRLRHRGAQGVLIDSATEAVGVAIVPPFAAHRAHGPVCCGLTARRLAKSGGVGHRAVAPAPSTRMPGESVASAGTAALAETDLSPLSALPTAPASAAPALSSSDVERAPETPAGTHARR